jgi:hypothetical protein
MTNQLKFEVGRHYRTRGGHKALCVHIWPHGGVLFVCDDRPFNAWTVRSDGTFAHGQISHWDIIDEWREPRTWEVYVMEYADGITRVTQFHAAAKGKIIARVTVTEGEGLE